MSEEILKALMQLFALLVKQDEGVEDTEIDYVKKFLAQQLSSDAVQEYFNLFASEVGFDKGEIKLMSVKDSVRILGLCRKINKTLNQRQKVVVLVRLFELVNAERKFSAQRMAVINTVAEVFNISKDDFKSIESFAIKESLEDLDLPSLLLVNNKEMPLQAAKKIQSEPIDGSIMLLQIKSSELYFVRYTGNQEVFLNGFALNNKRIYLFAPGSTLKLPKGRPIYYSDVVARFLADSDSTNLSFNVENVSFRFPTGDLGLRNISFSQPQGKLVGIMGASGAGKTTLLNVLSGINEPTEGRVLINGIDMHKEKQRVEGVIGYIPQDDLLIEELTVFQNLYFCAKQCFNDKSEEEIIELVNKTLKNLGLYERRNLKVGSPLNKMISGGQRKRLNIALELIREPSMLFVDEPTSGLSSRDSENVMELLSELTLKGKLIFVVIHQPSSDIYKMFDQMIILDTGGYLIYFGNPVEAIIYFKKLDNQINADVGECPTCGNITPELIFNIVEAKVVDDFGRYTDNRKVVPRKWEEIYKVENKTEKVPTVTNEPPRTLNIPSWFKQFKIYTIRDFMSKVSNTQYVVLNFLEAPLLGFILSYIIRYIADPDSDIYIFRDNQNIPPYIFLSIVVALFLGLTVSAEEIFKDRKILKREKFLNLSRSSYLLSKILILTIISAIQSFLFVVVGNNILVIDNMFMHYWLALFTVFVFANMMGLNISASFNSAVTIYILIPLLMIPQMALGGAMFSFDKLNRTISSPDKVPFIAEFMAARWAYEGLMVHQFKNNRFEQFFYDIEQKEIIADFKSSHYTKSLRSNLDTCEAYFEIDTIDAGTRKRMETSFALLRNEIAKEMRRVPDLEFGLLDKLYSDKFDYDISSEVRSYIEELEKIYIGINLEANKKRQDEIIRLKKEYPGWYQETMKATHNEYLADIVRKVLEKKKILQEGDRLIQNIEPIFLLPEPEHPFNFRCHFYAPKKHLFGTFFETYWFNISVIWLMTILLYITLYYEHLKRLLTVMERIDVPAPIKRFVVKSKGGLLNLAQKLKRKKETPKDTKDTKDAKTKSEKPEKLEKGERGEKAEKVEKVVSGEKVEKSEKPEKPEKPERADRGERLSRLDRPERPERPERPRKEKTENSEKNEQVEKKEEGENKPEQTPPQKEDTDNEQDKTK